MITALVVTVLLLCAMFLTFVYFLNQKSQRERETLLMLLGQSSERSHAVTNSHLQLLCQLHMLIQKQIDVEEDPDIHAGHDEDPSYED